MQIAAASPRYVRREDVPTGVIEQERSILCGPSGEQRRQAGAVIGKWSAARSEFFADVCLLKQPFIKDQDKPVGQLLSDAVGKLGENMVVRRFCASSWASSRARAEGDGCAGRYGPSAPRASRPRYRRVLKLSGEALMAKPPTIDSRVLQASRPRSASQPARSGGSRS
jgi:translation elongation factor EF-Ts